ncbi:MAG: hypothetical protein IKR59_02535 [Lachnospiraceae bacterium]|nr:hypothetical protein [Lachnospiraceae bacterium]
MYEKLVSCGVPADYYVIEGANHGDELIYQDEVKEKVLAFVTGTQPAVR